MESCVFNSPETLEGEIRHKRNLWHDNQQRCGLAASAADFVSQTGMFSSAVRLRTR